MNDPKNAVKFILTAPRWVYKEPNNETEANRCGYLYTGAYIICNATKPAEQCPEGVDALNVLNWFTDSDWIQIGDLKVGNMTNPINGSTFAIGDIAGKYIKFKDGIKTYTRDADISIAQKEVNILDSVKNSIASIFNTTQIQYSLAQSEKNYLDNLSQGLRVSDIVGVHGMPHQFLPDTDPRIDGSLDNDRFGRKYTEKIIQPIPLLLMTPGVANFMSGFSKEDQSNMLNGIIGDNNELLKELVGGMEGKYFSLKFDYTHYYRYVNGMLRSAAYFLKIQDTKVYGTKLGTFNWMYDLTREDSDITGHTGLSKFIGPYANCVAFYVNAGTEVSDSFGNDTTQSQLAQTINGLSDTAKEINFVTGSIGAVVNAGGIVDKLMNNGLNSALENVSNTVDSIMGKGNLLSRLTKNVGAIMSGSRMQFPEIWNDSSFSRSYSCSMKLISPAGDKLSIFLNILVPMFFILAFALPRSSTSQSYYSPFLVRAFCKGLFNIDMGIIDSLSITKGAEGEWTIDGLPTVVDINFSIKDLYTQLSMSSNDLGDDISIMSNTAELDYIANACGININEPDIVRTIKMYATLGFTTRITDSITIGLFGTFMQSANQKINDIFGRF